MSPGRDNSAYYPSTSGGGGGGGGSMGMGAGSYGSLGGGSYGGMQGSGPRSPSARDFVEGLSSASEMYGGGSRSPLGGYGARESALQASPPGRGYPGNGQVSMGPIYGSARSPSPPSIGGGPLGKAYKKPCMLLERDMCTTTCFTL